jgi:hypothetical protein
MCSNWWFRSTWPLRSPGSSRSIRETTGAALSKKVQGTLIYLLQAPFLDGNRIAFFESLKVIAWPGDHDSEGVQRSKGSQDALRLEGRDRGRRWGIKALATDSDWLRPIWQSILIRRYMRDVPNALRAFPREGLIIH